jgi:hypothetical protein
MNAVAANSAIQTIRFQEEFRQARNRALLQQVFTRLRRQPNGLLCFDAVRTQLGFRGLADQGLQEIDVDKVVGSVGRHLDFSSNFQPRRDSSRDRWLQIRRAHEEMRGLPPIEVYQIDDVYFVSDGHHRMSVARAMNLLSIAAIVTKVETQRPFAGYEASGHKRSVLARAAWKKLPAGRAWLARQLIRWGRHLQRLGDPCSGISAAA